MDFRLFHEDAGWMVLFLWLGLMENFKLLHTYFNPEELSSFCEARCWSLHGRLSMGNKGNIISIITWLSRPSCSWMTMSKYFGGQPSFSRIFQSPFLSTVPNAFDRSTYVIYNHLFCSLCTSLESVSGQTPC